MLKLYYILRSILFKENRRYKLLSKDWWNVIKLASGFQYKKVSKQMTDNLLSDLERCEYSPDEVLIDNHFIGLGDRTYWRCNYPLSYGTECTGEWKQRSEDGVPMFWSKYGILDLVPSMEARYALHKFVEDNEYMFIDCRYNSANMARWRRNPKDVCVKYETVTDLCPTGDDCTVGGWDGRLPATNADQCGERHSSDTGCTADSSCPSVWLSTGQDHDCSHHETF